MKKRKIGFRKIKAFFRKSNTKIAVNIIAMTVFISIICLAIVNTVLVARFENWKTDFIQEFQPNERKIELVECLAEFDGRLMPTSKCYAPLKEQCIEKVRYITTEKECTPEECSESPKVDLAMMCKKEYDRGYNMCVELYDIESKLIPTCKPKPNGGIMR